MNRIGKGPNLTWIFIGIAFAITAITLSMTSFNTLLEDNGISISDNFDNIYGNISAEQAEINSIQSEASSKGNIYDVVKDIGGGALVVFVTGLSSIGAFFSMGKIGKLNIEYNTNSHTRTRCIIWIINISRSIIYYDEINNCKKGGK